MIAPDFVVLTFVDLPGDVEDVFAVGPFAVGGRAAAGVFGDDDRVLQAVGDLLLPDRLVPDHHAVHGGGNIGRAEHAAVVGVCQVVARVPLPVVIAVAGCV